MSYYINYWWLYETRQSRLLLIGTTHFIHSFIHSIVSSQLGNGKSTTGIHLFSFCLSFSFSFFFFRLFFLYKHSIRFPSYKCKREKWRRRKSEVKIVLAFILLCAKNYSLSTNFFSFIIDLMDNSYILFNCKS